jgi:hypothetical protein
LILALGSIKHLVAEGWMINCVLLAVNQVSLMGKQLRILTMTTNALSPTNQMVTQLAFLTE